MFKRKYIAYLLAPVLLILITATLFFSNSLLQFLFPKKVWAHRVNTVSRLKLAQQNFSGAELDVVYDLKGNFFDINHPPDKSIGLSLAEYLKDQQMDTAAKFWIDFKNLNKDNQEGAFKKLKVITNKFKLNRSNIFVESRSPLLLDIFRKSGFKTSYYLPSDLHSLNKKNLNEALTKIQKIVKQDKGIYLSFNYKDYPIVKRYFPNKKLLTWFTTYGSMNSVSARILVYKILLDPKVEVMLIQMD